MRESESKLSIYAFFLYLPELLQVNVLCIFLLIEENKGEKSILLLCWFSVSAFMKTSFQHSVTETHQAKAFRLLRKLGANAQLHNKCKWYQPNNFEHWVLKIVFLQQETQSVG